MLNTTTLTINSKVIVIAEVLDLSDPSIIVTHLTHCPMTRRPEPILLCCILDRNMLIYSCYAVPVAGEGPCGTHTASLAARQLVDKHIAFITGT